ncbi:LiaF domain-containing protein [Camelliibacillus cellulosilyticus]|uniref:LiaF domain-containing protein n=1 Tax=Camelliibacillus cellulosilyticus TaxID=2174486 RepID=A0ABV9GM99_9BACL
MRFSFGNFIIAAIFIFVGGWLLLSNMNMIDTGFSAFFSLFVAAVILLFGLWHLFSPLFRGRGPHWFIGLFCTIYGGLLIANDFHYLTFHWSDFWKLWPVLIIWIGFEMLGPIRMKRSRRYSHGSFYSYRKDRDKWEEKWKEKEDKWKKKAKTWKDTGKDWQDDLDDFIDHTARAATKAANDATDAVNAACKSADKKTKKTSASHLGKGTSVLNIVKEYHFDKPNWPVEPLDLWAMVSDYDFDFTQAFIPDRETDIHLSGWIGEVKIIIPEDVDFAVKGYGNITNVKIDGQEWDSAFSHKEIVYQTPGFDAATRRLVFDIQFKILDLRIDRV